MSIEIHPFQFFWFGAHGSLISPSFEPLRLVEKFPAQYGTLEARRLRPGSRAAGSILPSPSGECLMLRLGWPVVRPHAAQGLSRRARELVDRVALRNWDPPAIHRRLAVVPGYELASEMNLDYAARSTIPRWPWASARGGVDSRPCDGRPADGEAATTPCSTNSSVACRGCGSGGERRRRRVRIEEEDPRISRSVGEPSSTSRPASVSNQFIEGLAGRASTPVVPVSVYERLRSTNSQSVRALLLHGDCFFEFLARAPGHRRGNTVSTPDRRHQTARRHPGADAALVRSLLDKRERAREH